MPGLAEYQRKLLTVLLGQPVADFELAAHPGVAVHRSTVLAGLVKALALSFPTVKKLTGPDYFERLANEFASRRPPGGPILYEYGAELPQFLAAFPGAADYPYFGDVARFDWAVDQTAHRPPHPFRSAHSIPAGGRLRLPASLICLRFEYAVDLIRDAVESERAQELEALDVGPNPRLLALWRGPAGTSVKALSVIAWHLLSDLLAGYDGETAFERAAESGTPAQVWAAFHNEIVPSSFARLN